MGTGYVDRFGDQDWNCLKIIPDRKQGSRQNCAAFPYNGQKKARIQKTHAGFSRFI